MFIYYLAALLTIFIVGHTVYLIWKYYDHYVRSRKYHPVKGNDPILNKVYLHLSTPFQMTCILLDKLSIPLDRLTIHSPQNNTITFKLHLAAWTAMMTIDWSGISLQLEEGNEIPLPPNVKIPKTLNHLLTMIKATQTKGPNFSWNVDQLKCSMISSWENLHKNGHNKSLRQDMYRQDQVPTYHAVCVT